MQKLKVKDLQKITSHILSTKNSTKRFEQEKTYKEKKLRNKTVD